MRIGVIGTGYVGLVTATCLADSGNHVVAMDRDAEKIAQLHRGEPNIYEPGLAELLRANLASGRLRFSTEVAAAAADAEVIFLAIGTPPGESGAADVSGLELAVRQLIPHLTRPVVLVIKSTAPPGTGARLQSLVDSEGRQAAVVSNPEFLKEGDAVNDFLRPDRVVIGAEDSAAGDLVEELYRPFVRNNRPILRMSRAAAELTKYAANAYLAMRISFINEIADLCGRLNIDVNEVRRGIGTDLRIGQHFLYPGLGYGGSCFPKDVQALAAAAREAGVSGELFDAVHRRNLAQRTQMLSRVTDRLRRLGDAKRVAMWGLAFKPKTDDVREAPAIDLARGLLAEGFSLAVYDPQAMDNARRILGDAPTYAPDAYEALREADALVICTEWNEFRSPDFPRMRQSMRHPIIFDGRNLYEAGAIRRYGFEYHSIGRPSVTGS
jgi:UDPglucose 6-dehydrogenase